MTDEERNAELVRLDEILDDFVNKRTRCDNNYSFVFMPIAKSESLEDTYENYLKELGNRGIYISLQPLNEENLGILDVSECLCEWLFGITGYTPYRQSTDEILETMIRVSQATRLWKVTCDTTDWYECSWDDFLFESEKQVFVLHLGVSD